MELRKSRWVVAFVLASSGMACNALFNSTAQCEKDSDCASIGARSVCGAGGTCVAPFPGTSGTDASVPDPMQADSSTQPPPKGGALDNIVVTPSSTSVVKGATQQFTAVGKDALGNPPSPAAMFTWSVSGGGTIGSTGLFTANASGGPFTVTATSGSVVGKATVTVTVATPMTITIGETNVLNNDDSGNADLLLAQEADLPQAATIKSLSFYVTTAAGMLRLGLYDATGPDGGPGAKKAETNEMAAVMGFNTINVITPVLLPAGKYWLAYAPSDSNLHFRLAGDGTGKLAYFSQPYGPMPATFSTTPSNQTDHWTFYATLQP